MPVGDSSLKARRFRSVNRPPPKDYPDYPRWIASATNLATDPGNVSATNFAITPPPGLIVGDLVVVYAWLRDTAGIWDITTTGGQDWIKCGKHGATNSNLAVFFCRFNGVWAANPAFTCTGGAAATIIGTMHAFRSVDPPKRWALDQTPALGSSAVTGVIVTGITPNAARTVAIASIVSVDDNEYAITANSGFWKQLGVKQYRNTGGIDGSMTHAYYHQGPPQPTGNVTLTQTTLGAAPSIWIVTVFKEGDDFEIGTAARSIVPGGKALGGRNRQFLKNPGAYTVEAAVGTTYFQDVGGVLSFLGELQKQINKQVGGDLAFTGDIQKLTSKGLDGGLSFVGVVQKQTNKNLSGAVGFSGNLDASQVSLQALEGSLSFSGDLQKQTNKQVGGSVGFVGGLQKQTHKNLSGVVSFVGDLARSFTTSRALTGVLSFVGDLATLFIAGGGGIVKNFWTRIWRDLWKDMNDVDEDT